MAWPDTFEKEEKDLPNNKAESFSLKQQKEEVKKFGNSDMFTFDESLEDTRPEELDLQKLETLTQKLSISQEDIKNYINNKYYVEWTEREIIYDDLLALEKWELDEDREKTIIEEIDNFQTLSCSE